METNNLIELFKPDYDIFFGVQKISGEKDYAPYVSFNLQTGKTNEYFHLDELCVAIQTTLYDSKRLLFSPGLGKIDSLNTSYHSLDYSDRHKLNDLKNTMFDEVSDFNEDIPDISNIFVDSRLN